MGVDTTITAVRHLIFAALVLFSCQATAQVTVPLDVAYLLDADGTLSLSDVSTTPREKWTTAPNQSVSLQFWEPEYWSGMQGAALWLRLEIPQQTTLNRLWLELLPNTGIEGRAAQFQGGKWQWIYPVGKDPDSSFYQPARYLTFILDTSVPEKTLYVRLTTQQVFEFSVRATPAEGLLWQLLESQFLCGTVIGMLFLAMLYNLA
ncbi:MAG: 7TM-DISM domain-containing protein, partial [Ketobacteraceae bacterium]|nr:7TM-DISM domain-containing protein [Ketobacteraceae bacterium]